MTTPCGWHTRLQDVVLTGDYARILMPFVERPASLEEMQRELGLSRAQLQKAVTFFAFQHFILRRDQSDDDVIAETVHRLGKMGKQPPDVAHFSKLFRDHSPLNLQTFAAHP